MTNNNLNIFEQDILDGVENDLYKLKRKSLESDMPYQNLMQMLVHQCANNKIHLDV